MKGHVSGIDWVNAEAMKYWSYPKSYKKDFKAEIKNYIFSGDYWGSLKKDGFYQRVVKDEDGEIFMISRNKSVSGESINKAEWVPHLRPFFDRLPKGTVLLCEIYLPSKEGSKNVTSLLGCLKDKCIERQEKGEKLSLYVFDICAWGGKDFSKIPAYERFRYLDSGEVINLGDEYVEFVKYYNGKELWEKLCQFLEEGREGMVITHKDCPIYFKRTPARKTIKIKKELANTIDCFFTGRFSSPSKKYTGKELETWKYFVNARTDERLPEAIYFKEYVEGEPIEPVTKSYYYSYAGSLEIGVLKGNKIVPIGMLSGLTEEIKAKPQDYKMRCIEVNAMEIDSESNSLRHAKMVGFRDDLTPRDCTYEKVFG